MAAACWGNPRGRIPPTIPCSVSTGTTEEGALRTVGAVFTRVAATLVASALRGTHVQIQNASTPISVTHTNTDITITNTGLMCAMRSYSQIAMTVCMLASDQLFSAVGTDPKRSVHALCSSTPPPLTTLLKDEQEVDQVD